MTRGVDVGKTLSLHSVNTRAYRNWSGGKLGSGGAKEVRSEGWVYLLPDEYEEYEAGKRVFGLWGPESSSSAAKVRVSDEVVEGLEKWVENDEEIASNSLQSQSGVDRY